MVQKIITFNVALKSTERQRVQKIPEVYTNDLGSVSIQFNITDCTDTELTGSSAIVLLKMRDGSFFQGPSADVSRTLNVFSYTLKENEGNHDGLAEIQLIVSITGKEFATQKYQFKVNSGLDSEVAREIMIYDWTSLTAEARAYIDQFTADEMVRDAEFDNAQFDRNVDFEVANTARNEAFALAQTQRNTDFGTDQAARVLAFNNAETARVNAFNLAEAARAEGYAADHARAETDHTKATSDATLAATARTNAATDRTNAATDRNLAAADHTRAESDHTRADADSATVAGFNTRLTAEETATAANKISAVKGKTFADVDARFEDVEADTTMMGTNLVTNGDFSNGTVGWSPTYGANQVINGVLVSTADGTVASIARVSQTLPTFPIGDVYYARAKARVTNAACTELRAYIFDGVSTHYVLNAIDPMMNGWYEASTVFKVKATGSNRVFLTHKYVDFATTAGKQMEADNVSLINLTAAFGAGNEPTAEQMDAIMAKFENSWFDGTKNLFQAKASLNKLMALDARTEFEARNGIINGNFSNGVVGWQGSTPLTELGNGTVKATPTGVTSYVEPSTVTTIPAKNGNKIYMASYIKSSPDATHEKLMIGAGTTQVLLMNNGSLTHPSGAWLSAIATLSGQTDGRMITAYVSNAFSTAEIAGASSFSFGYVTLIDLTATFGAGKEPTLAEMDRLMARFPNSWFDGVKPIQTIETLYQEKANKVQEAWITPTLVNGAVQHATRPFQYRRTTYNSLQFRGEVSNCPINNGYITILADGYRPASNAYAVGNRGNTFSVVSVLTNGSISMNGTNVTFALFDNIEIPLD